MKNLILFIVVLFMISCPQAVGKAESESGIKAYPSVLGKVELSEIEMEESVPDTIRDLCRIVGIIDEMDEAEKGMTVEKFSNMLDESGAVYSLTEYEANGVKMATYRFSEFMGLSVLALADAEEAEYIVYVELFLDARSHMKDSGEKILYSQGIQLYDTGMIEVVDLSEAVDLSD